MEFAGSETRGADCRKETEVGTAEGPPRTHLKVQGAVASCSLARPFPRRLPRSTRIRLAHNNPLGWSEPATYVGLWPWPPLCLRPTK